MVAAAAAVLAFVFSISWPLSFVGSYTRYESLPIRLSYLGLLAAPVWLVRDPQSRNRVIPAFVIGTTVACFEALLQWALGVGFRPDGNLGNANLLGALIAMALPLAVGRGLRSGRFAVAWSVAAAVLAGGLIVSTSRSGALGALAGCLALAVFAFRGRVAAIAALASGAVIAVALLAIVLSPIRLLNNDPGPIRLQLWPDAVQMVAARPLTGWGPDTTGLVFGRFLRADWLPGITIDRAHSGPLDIGATQGLIGLAALGWVLLVLFRGGWRWRFSGTVGALTAACIGYTVWVLFNFDWAPATGAFWLLAGTAWSGVRDAQTEASSGADISQAMPPRATLRPLRSLGAVAMALAAVGLGAMPLLADVWYAHGRLDLAVVADPLQAQYHRVLGESLVATGSPSRGLNELQLAARLGESDPQMYVDIGDAEQGIGRPAEARAAYQMALRIDPFFVPARRRLAGLGAPASG
jgi:hypothetical protein